MIIIELIGGLGNQMFQYALFLKLVSLGKNVKFDITTPQKQNLMLLEQYFNISLPIASKKEVEEMRDSSLNFFARVRRKIWGSKDRIYVDKLNEVQKQIFEMDDIYLSGYWQSEKYFSDIENQVREVFSIKTELSEYQKEVFGEIKKTESVSVHLRRGDYLQLSDIYGNICTEKYYQNAMEIFKEKGNIKFFIFSNDYEYVRQIYSGDKYVVVQASNDEATCNNDLFLMSQCKHNIIANSTFSWWGSWLNENSDKIVIAPRRWVNTMELKDIYCPKWVKLGGDR